MRVGTKSLLFGCHQFAIHPLFVAVAWWCLYGAGRVEFLTYGVRTSLLDWRLWVCFVVHDWGYWGSPNMDGLEGEQHPRLGARIAHALFDGPGEDGWRKLLLYHSRFLAKRDGAAPSAFCMADKLAIALYPPWVWVPLAWLTGEGREYMLAHAGPGVPDSSLWVYFGWVRPYVRRWVEEHRGGRADSWTQARSGAK